MDKKIQVMNAQLVLQGVSSKASKEATDKREDLHPRNPPEHRK